MIHKNENVICCVYPNAHIYVDRTVEYQGDYKEVARIYLHNGEMVMKAPLDDILYERVKEDLYRIRQGIKKQLRMDNKNKEIWFDRGWSNEPAHIVRVSQKYFTITVDIDGKEKKIAIEEFLEKYKKGSMYF